MLRNFSKRIPADGNTAAATVAYQLSEASLIYPITPATPMGELVDAWIAQGRKNVWGEKVRLSMMQAESGVAGALHGATATGTITSSFTAAQGLLLMIPDMYKIVAEYCPAIIHVASRAIANGGMSIFNDHSDIYAARSSLMPTMCSNTVQEVYDLGAISHLSTIKASIPFMHFFDGFRTSHEVNTFIDVPSEELFKLVDHEALRNMRKIAMNPEHPSVRGPILGAEYHWLAAEKPNQDFARFPDLVNGVMQQYGKLTGRYYKPFEYFGHPQAEHVVVLMGSGVGTIQEYVNANPDKKIGVIKVHLYRPFSTKYLLDVLPKSVKKICVLDKVRDFVASREPLFLDVCGTLSGKCNAEFIGGRYGIGSKDFAPNHAEAIFKNLEKPNPIDSFTVGIAGSETGLPIGKPFDKLPAGTRQCLFWGLGSDGTVGSNKEAIKIIVDNTDLHGQAYFAYSAHKSGGLTVSHVRFGKEQISASYLIQHADYIACHTPAYTHKFDMIDTLKDGGVFCINCPENANFDELFPPSMRKKLAEKNAKIYYIDASKIAAECGMAGRINMPMQTAFFALSGVMPTEKCIELMKKSIQKQYIRKGKDVVEKNWKMVDASVSAIHELKYDKSKWLNLTPEKIKKWTGYKRSLQLSIQNRADDLTIKEFTRIAEMPPGTSKIEKRGIALKVPKWDKTKCIQCNQCAFLCPHAVIRPFLLDQKESIGLQTIKATGKAFKGLNFRIQITPYDCTGCSVCVSQCPTKALSMIDVNKDLFEVEDANWQQCNEATNKAHLVQPTNVRNSQFAVPLLEFSGACPGCGEPAIIKLITQLYGDQLYLANAAGCSVVWSSSYPWNPYTTNEHGHGPTWAFSLFEDNAEFGYGMYHSAMTRRNVTYGQIQKALKTENLPSKLSSLFEKILKVWETDESAAVSREIQAELAKLSNPSELLKDIISQKDVLAKKNVWIMGGDGWAYDIGYGGLDHVLASGEDVNVIVLDTEVYSNTGGQCSKATSRGAVANFSAAGYAKQKKDLGAIMMTYGSVYVASTCMLADPEHALKCIREAGSYKGPSLVINYAPCISHGIKQGLSYTPQHARELLQSGYILLYRYDPRRTLEGKNPLQLDSKKPDFSLAPLFKGESRFASLKDIYPKEAEIKQPQLVEDLKKRYEYYAKQVGK